MTVFGVTAVVAGSALLLCGAQLLGKGRVQAETQEAEETAPGAVVVGGGRSRGGGRGGIAWDTL